MHSSIIVFNKSKSIFLESNFLKKVLEAGISSESYIYWLIALQLN